MSKPAPPKYRTTNWKSYTHALRQRGSLLIWLDKDMAWFAAPTGKRGRAERFSDAAIQFCLMVKNLFNLALRQTTGMVASLLKLAGL
ncbi:IS5/IS1182 family transposase, partial [Chitinilyticum aquatile]|uniref:IS5/IS1182 family transposase n=1 Tax=Chitinilyticum aquatile TaxID=362520 RepID=UPI00048E4BED